jgi:hypothetical protein
MSSAALAKMISTCHKLAEALPTMGGEIIKTADVAVNSAIPPFWPTYRAGIVLDMTPPDPSISLMASKIEGAVNQHIIDWAQKVFPVAGKSAPMTASDYVYDSGGAYPLQIEESGSPAYPGNRATGAGKAVWKLAAEAANRRFMELINKATI